MAKTMLQIVKYIYIYIYMLKGYIAFRSNGKILRHHSLYVLTGNILC